MNILNFRLPSFFYYFFSFTFIFCNQSLYIFFLLFLSSYFSVASFVSDLSCTLYYCICSLFGCVCAREREFYINTKDFDWFIERLMSTIHVTAFFVISANGMSLCGTTFITISSPLQLAHSHRHPVICPHFQNSSFDIDVPKCNLAFVSRVLCKHLVHGLIRFDDMTCTLAGIKRIIYRICPSGDIRIFHEYIKSVIFF